MLGDLRFIKKIPSKADNTVKYVFRTATGEIVELSYIKKDGDNKDIICASTQTSCNLGCKFCFLSDYDLKVRNLKAEEISLPIDYIIKDLALPKNINPSEVLLISFMGCGEPLLNLENVIAAAKLVRAKYNSAYPVVRFAIATLIPHPKYMDKLIKMVKAEGLLVKLHLSLHSPDSEVRAELMPAAHSIEESISLLNKFRLTTDNHVEIHYAMIDGINDRNQDLSSLIKLFSNSGIPIKFLVYNQKPSLDLKESPRVAFFREELAKHGIVTEFYIPPGRDVGSSCGQFLMEYYEIFNKK